MALSETDRDQLRKALDLALAWHGDQPRKGTRIPYVSHLLQVAGLVLEHGGDVDQAVAGFLHDSLEDAEKEGERQGREAIIEKEFGPGVLALVRGCTDTQEHETKGKKAPWLPRKSRYLAQLAEADARTALVAACDKVHNLGSLAGDVWAHGTEYLERFSGTPGQQVWYYHGVLEALRGRIPERLENELAELLEDFRSLAETAD